MSDTRRDQLIDYIEKEFIGPDPIDWPGMTQSNGEEILTTDPPRTRYIAGILYPRETTDTDVDTREGESEPVTGPEGEDPGAEPAKKSRATPEFLENAEELINRSNAYRQSAISITVAIKSEDNVRVKVSAGTYTTLTAIDPKTERKVTTYPRTALSWENDGNPLILPTADKSLRKEPIGNTGLQFDITYRYRAGNSTIYTFTLENTKGKKGSSVRDDECFFQVKFTLFSEKGFSPLSEGQRITEDEDYRSNQLLYLSDAAQEGNQYAQYALGKLYLTGEDVTQDREQAYSWFWESASQGNEYAQFFLDHFNDNRSPNVLLSATKLLHHMGRIFQDNSIPPCPPGSQRADRKLRQKIRQKKIAMGHKPDDHEEEQNMGGMTMGGM